MLAGQEASIELVQRWLQRRSSDSAVETGEYNLRTQVHQKLFFCRIDINRGSKERKLLKMYLLFTVYGINIYRLAKERKLSNIIFLFIVNDLQRLKRENSSVLLDIQTYIGFYLHGVYQQIHEETALWGNQSIYLVHVHFLFRSQHSIRNMLQAWLLEY